MPIGSGQPSMAARCCALLVVDVQNDFCHSDGALARRGLDVRPLQQALPPIVRLIETARAANVPRIYLRTEHCAWFDDLAWRQRGMASGTLDTDRIPITPAGSWGADFYHLAPGPDELVLVKHRHSGFAYSPLELALRAQGCDTIVLAGITTNVCIRTTAVDGLARGFYPILVAECLASSDSSEHAATLSEFPRYMGAVQTLDDMAAAWNLPSGDPREV